MSCFDMKRVEEEWLAPLRFERCESYRMPRADAHEGV